jgi:PadR family transcriptional regulator PadR
LLSVTEGREKSAEVPMSKPTDLVQGTVDLLILKVVALEPIHGWAVAQRIQQVSNDVLKLNQSSLYPALHRLEKQGWVQSEWGISEHGRRAKYYSLTNDGKKRLDKELADWQRLSSAISLVTHLA